MSRVVRPTLYFFIASLVWLTGCTDSKPVKAGAREVNLAIWANYLSPETAARFTKQTGIKLNVSNYSSNEELLAKIQAGAAGLDVAVPSEYMVVVLKKLDLLQPLDAAQVPNKAGLDPKFTKQPYDPENQYSVPYSWTSVGLAVNRDLYKGKLTSYKELLTNTDLAGKFSMLDDVREVTSAALKVQGHSVNTVDPEHLKQAKEMILAARPRIKMFTSDTIDPLVNKEIAVAQTFSSDALQAARKSKSKIEFFIPDEGGTRALDSLVVMKASKNSKEAMELINFLISAEANLEFVQKNMGGPVVTATKAALPKELASSQTLYPSDATLKKLEPIEDVGEGTRLYDRLWTELKTE